MKLCKLPSVLCSSCSKNRVQCLRENLINLCCVTSHRMDVSRFYNASKLILFYQKWVKLMSIKIGYKTICHILTLAKLGVMTLFHQINYIKLV